MWKDTFFDSGFDIRGIYVFVKVGMASLRFGSNHFPPWNIHAIFKVIGMFSFGVKWLGVGAWAWIPDRWIKGWKPPLRLVVFQCSRFTGFEKIWFQMNCIHLHDSNKRGTCENKLWHLNIYMYIYLFIWLGTGRWARLLLPAAGMLDTTIFHTCSISMPYNIHDMSFLPVFQPSLMIQKYSKMQYIWVINITPQKNVYLR